MTLDLMLAAARIPWWVPAAELAVAAAAVGWLAWERWVR